MTRAEHIARTILADDALGVRALVQDWYRSGDLVANEPSPETTDEVVRTLAAALTELVALRLHQSPPPWTAAVGALREPLYLVKAALQVPSMKRRIELETPEPLQRRHVYAPADYLAFV